MTAPDNTLAGEVVQADRERAAKHTPTGYKFRNGYTFSYSHLIRSGDFDHQQSPARFNQCTEGANTTFKYAARFTINILF